MPPQKILMWSYTKESALERKISCYSMPLILLIMPDKATGNILAIGLRRYGYDVISAERGSEGVLLALTESPDLIVMDIDGWEAIKIFKESHITGATPVVALAKRRVDGDLLVQRGFDAYERKPALLKRIITRAKILLPNQLLPLSSTNKQLSTNENTPTSFHRLHARVM